MIKSKRPSTGRSQDKSPEKYSNKPEGTTKEESIQVLIDLFIIGLRKSSSGKTIRLETSETLKENPHYFKI